MNSQSMQDELSDFSKHVATAAVSIKAPFVKSAHRSDTRTANAYGVSLQSSCYSSLLLLADHSNHVRSAVKIRKVRLRYD